MISFTATIEKFGKNGDKTGWTFCIIPKAKAQILNKGVKKSFRVKGTLDQFQIQQVAIMPMGGGDFILGINASMRKGTGKKAGAKLLLQLELDKSELPLNADLLLCLDDDKAASAYFYSISRSNQSYFSKWVDSAKTDATKVKRITTILEALHKKQDYGTMLRNSKTKNE